MAISQESAVFETKLSNEDAIPTKTVKLENGEHQALDTASPPLPNIIEQFDPNYLLELSKIDLGGAELIDPTDHIAMRAWLKDYYFKIPKDIQIKRLREPVEVQAKDVSISYSTDSHFRIRVYNPIETDRGKGSLRPALLMMHGGGWIHGFPEIDEDLSKFFASELRAVVIGIDYRLAPEHPFPESRDDCYEALNWVYNNAKEYDIDTDRVLAWGASAGANLAASLVLKDLAENDKARIKHLNLVAPITCHPDLYPPTLKSSNASLQRFPFAGTIEQSQAGVRRLWDIYAGNNTAHPHVSMLTASIPQNHPSVHVTVAGCDGLRDEGIAYALHLRNAGTDAQLEIIPGVPHGINVSTVSLAAQQFFRNQVRSLNSAIRF